MREQKVSARYANALMDVAEEFNVIQIILKDLELIENTISSNKELSALTFSPVIPEHKKKSIFEEIFKDSVNDLTLKFLKLIIEKNRIEIIFNIRAEFIKLYNKKFDIQPVTITSANELGKDMSDSLLHKLNQSTGKTILPEFKIDKKLKGGLKIRIDDIIYDASVQSQLKLLRDRLIAK